MRMRRKPWVRTELEQADFFIDDATKYIGKWHKQYKRQNNPLHLELRMWERNFYCKVSM